MLTPETVPCKAPVTETNCCFSRTASVITDTEPTIDSFVLDILVTKQLTKQLEN